MRPFFVLAALLALVTSPSTRADIIAPTDFYPIGVSLDTILRSNGARQYQEFLRRDVFQPVLTGPLLITGLQVRLPNTVQTVWPTNDTTFSNYIIQIGVASTALTNSGGQFDPTPAASFATNMVNAVTVYNGPLTISAGSFVGGVSAPIITFNTANYLLQKNTDYVVYISHTVSDQNAGTFTPGFETVGSSNAIGHASAVYAVGNDPSIVPNFTNSGDPYKINFVTGPVTSNLSTRGVVGTGANILIGGFIISGTVPKKVVLRAIGPSLGTAVTNPLQDPALVLIQGQTTIATNDNWGNLSAADQAVLVANNLVPTDPRESALVLTLPPGAYTPQVIGVGGTVGTALVEAYDIDPLSASTLTNISTRTNVGTVNDVMIAGFILTGNQSSVLIRGIGPSLTALGVPGALADPMIQLINQAGAVVASNDNWGTNSNAAAISALGLAPTFGKESALFITLPAGKYTCILRGVGATTGVGRIDVFQIPQ